MNAKYNKSNAATISSAFARFRVYSHEQILEAMKTLMQEAMEFALRDHDHQHQRHLEIGDGYGWMLWYDGNLEGYNITSGDSEVRGKALDQLMTFIPPKSKWYGVLLAYMQPSHYFAVDYENDVLNDTVRMSEEKFKRYFKRIVRGK